MIRLLLVVLLLAGCAAEPAPVPARPHGYVEGAEEVAEAQSRLVVADAATGAVRVLDLITEEVTELDPVSGEVRGIDGDGRFAYLATDDSVHVVDSGAWLVDHTDHIHYYRAEVRAVGTVPGRDATGVHSDSVVSAVSFDDTVALLDRAELDRGRVRRSGTLRGGVAVPYREHLLVSEVDIVAVRSRTGEPVATIDVRCPRPGDAAVTRRGVVFSCADGALLVTEQDGAFTGVRIPYPTADTVPEADFRHRRMSATLVVEAGAGGVWSLDVAKRTWTKVSTGPVIAANTAGEGAPLLTLTEDGVLHSHDIATGAELASTPLLATPLSATPPVIEVDPTRAYVNDATAGVIHEIDYNDNLRVARELTVGIAPTHLVETGR